MFSGSPTPDLVVATAAEPNTLPTCGTPPGWRARGSRLIYKSNPPPFALPVLVQRGARDGACFEATFSSVGLRANDATVFKARSD